MAMVKTEELTVMGIERLYCTLQKATTDLASALNYRSFMSPAPRKSLFHNFFKLFRKEVENSEEKEMFQLLASLTILKSVFEENRPILIDGKIYFQFKGQPKGGSPCLQIGEIQSEYDLLLYLNGLHERISETLALPEISKAIDSPLFARYCPSLAQRSITLSDFYQRFLLKLNSEKSASLTFPVVESLKEDESC
ncbi:MAG: hypothetical protein HFJ30_09720 [Clostridia bacterium]|jgi:hypothetical protein|nr:hypothetical protein [Clostridia bacterium]